MEHGARLSTSRVMAIAFIFMSVLIVLSLSVNVIQGVNNYRLQNEQRTAVTPMAFNAPFACHRTVPTPLIYSRWRCHLLPSV